MSLWFQLLVTGLLADELKNIFDRGGESGNTAMKLFPHCCRFQITSVWTTIIFNLFFTTLQFQIGHQILITCSTHGLLRRFWKMSFNPDPSKQAQEVIFSRKIQKTCHPSIYFNNKSVKQVPSQKHLELILDNKLNFQEHLKNISNKVNKTIGLLPKL